MHPNIDGVALLSIAVIGINLFIGLFFLFKNRFRNDGYLFLYLLLLVIAYEMCYKGLIHSRLIYDFLLFYQPGRFYNLLIYPFFLFFALSITTSKFKLNIYHWLLLLVFAGYTLWTFGKGMLINLEAKRQLLDMFYADKRPGPFNYWSDGTTLLLSTLIPVAFLSVIAYDFYRFRQQRVDIQRSRLVQIFSMLILLYFLYYQLANLLYHWLYQITNYSMIEWPVDLVFLSITSLIFGAIALAVNTGSTFLPAARYSNSALEKEAYPRIIQQAKILLVEDQLYANPDLSLGMLAKKMEMNPKYLSQAINHDLQMSFIDFVNQYKIEAAKKQLLDQRNQHLTVEAIGQLAGFRSKSSFYRAFKKATGCTPNQYTIKNK